MNRAEPRVMGQKAQVPSESLGVLVSGDAPPLGSWTHVLFLLGHSHVVEVSDIMYVQHPEGWQPSWPNIVSWVCLLCLQQAIPAFCEAGCFWLVWC